MSLILMSRQRSHKKSFNMFSYKVKVRKQSLVIIKVSIELTLVYSFVCQLVSMARAGTDSDYSWWFLKYIQNLKGTNEMHTSRAFYH